MINKKISANSNKSYGHISTKLLFVGIGLIAIFIGIFVQTGTKQTNDLPAKIY